MKQKYLIKRVNYTIGHNGERIATGFVLDAGLVSDVDPLVGGEFVDEPKFSDQKEANEWHEQQVGKTLFCEELVVKAIATYGKTYIIQILNGEI